MSQVFYRWGAGRDESRVKFDGTHISVFDFKRQVMLGNNLGNGKDFDIVVLENGDELKDDEHQIARSSSLTVRRRPAIMKGRGTAQNYIVGTDASMSLTGEHRIEAHAREAMKDRMLNRGARGQAGTYGSMTKRFDGKEPEKKEQVAVTTGDADEDARIRAMLQQQEDTWEAMQEDLSTLPRFNAGGQQRRGPMKPAGPGGASKFDFSVAPDKEPPVGYICYRCGQKGHWIQNCPTNDDPTAQDRKRFVRVTGIPRSFLKTVETPTTGEGSSGGAMLTADGGFVRAVPDQRQWQKHAAAKPRALTGADVRDQEPVDAELTCGICKKLVWEAVRVPCCDQAYCEECIQSYLLEHDFECPACESKITSFDKLKPDEELRERAKGYVDGEVERSKKEGEEAEKAAEAGSGTPAPEGGAATPDVHGKNPFSGPLPDMNTLADYLQAMMQTLRNPLVPPQLKAQLQAHIKITNANLLQMQMLAAQGLMLGGMASMGGMGMANPMAQMGMMNQGNAMMGMGNGMPNQAMLQQQQQQQQQQQMLQQQQQQQQQPFRPVGRGGFRGQPFFRGRGGFARGRGANMGAMGVRRPAEDAGGPPEKFQRVA